MRRDLLLKLANLLEADAANPTGVKFDLHNWATKEDRSIPQMDCGTVACAMGLAAISGQFEGLKIYKMSNPEMWGIEFAKNGKVSFGFEAAQNLFEITEEVAMRLFIEDTYEVSEGAEAELAVAARIRALVVTSVEDL